MHSNRVSPSPDQTGQASDASAKSPAVLTLSPKSANRLPPLPEYAAASTPLQRSPLSSAQLPPVPAAGPAAHAQEPGSHGAQTQPAPSGDTTKDAWRDGCPPVEDPEALIPENFIPFRFADLRDQLIETFPDVFKLPETKKTFYNLCKWLSLRNSTRLALLFDDVYDVYSFIDPDNENESRLPESEKEGYMERFKKLFYNVLDKGDFEEVSQEFLDRAYKEENSWGGFMGTGLAVERVDTDVVDFKLWFRGNHKEHMTWRTWRTFFMEVHADVHEFDRLVVMYRKRPQEQIDYLQSLHHRSWLQKTWTSVFNWMYNIKELSPTHLDPGYLYLKLFKDVANTDIDMLLPGAMPKFSWLDYLLIWGSIAVAIGTATYKAASGTLKFDSMINIAMSVVLIIMPLYGAFRGYMSIKEKMQDLQFHLNNLFITHNLSCNTGVVACVLDEAQEQEDKEAMLAYFFLWRGLKSPDPVSKDELDKAVEDFLRTQVKRLNMEMELDFEVVDAIDKLQRMGILEEVEGEGPSRMFKVLPLDQACEAANIRMFDEAKEVMGVRRRKPGTAAGPAWQECVGTLPATGQKFRYFWNMETGQSSYEVPAEYIPLADPQPRPAGGCTAAQWSQAGMRL